MHAFGLLLGSVMGHPWSSDLLVKAQKIVTYFNASHKPLALFREAAKQQPGKQVGLQSSNSTRLTSVQLCESSVLVNQGTFTNLLATPEGRAAINSRPVLALLEDLHFFGDLHLLDAVIQPISWVIMAVQRRDTTLADITRCVSTYNTCVAVGCWLLAVGVTAINTHK
jgi:hypothetical protein